MKRNKDTLLGKAAWFVTRLWVWLPVTLGVLLVAALIALPFAIRHGVERWLTEQGAEQVRIDDVDFNLFLGRLSVRNLQFRTGGERSLVLPHASVSFAVWPLWRQQLVIQDIYLRDTSLTLEQTSDGLWLFAGLARPPAGKERTAWRVALQGIEIANSEVKYTSPGLSGTAAIERAEISLDYPGDTAAANALAGLRVRLRGRLQAEQTKPRWTLDTRVDADVRAEAPARDQAGAWRVSGKGEFRDLDGAWTEGNLRVAAAESLTVEALEMTGLDQLAIGSLQLDGLALAQPTAREDAPPLLKAARLRAGDIRYRSGQAMSIGEITAGGLHLVATHDKRGSWYALTPLRAFFEAFEKTPGTDKPAMPVRIGSLTIEEPGLIDLADYAIEPPFNSRITLTGAILTGIDTGSPPETPTEVAVKARIGKYATAELHGQVRAWRPDTDLSLLFKLREFELPALSAYASRMLGYRVISGQMGGDLDLQVAGGHLEGQSKLVFAKLAMKPKDDASAEKLKARLSVPLETGLAMLRDKNNNVNLEIQISGETQDPKFDLTDAINQAITRAMRTASVSYLKHYFQPYGTLITVAELAGKAMQLRLDPLAYVAGGDTPTPQAVEYLEKVGKLLQEREKLEVKLCGKSVPADAMADEAAARALAARRAERLKDMLVNQYGIASGRLFLCEPELDTGAEAQPRVDLLL